MSRDKDEQRQSPRKTLNCEARVSDPQTGETFRTMVINLSGGGTLFNAEHGFQVGRRLDLHVEPCSPRRPALAARIRVVRCEPRERGGYQVASVIERHLDEPEYSA